VCVSRNHYVQLFTSHLWNTECNTAELYFFATSDSVSMCCITITMNEQRPISSSALPGEPECNKNQHHPWHYLPFPSFSCFQHCNMADCGFGIINVVKFGLCTGCARLLTQPKLLVRSHIRVFHTILLLYFCYWIPCANVGTASPPTASAATMNTVCLWTRTTFP